MQTMEMVDGFGHVLLSSAAERNFYFAEGGRVSGEVTSFIAGAVEEGGRIEVPGRPTRWLVCIFCKRGLDRRV
jgi:hypothetical protein